MNCVSKINGVQIDNAEDLDIVMPMYNLKLLQGWAKQWYKC